MIGKVDVSIPGYIEIGPAWSRREMMFVGMREAPRSITIAVNKGVTVSIERTETGQIELVETAPTQQPVSWSGTYETFDYTSARRGLMVALSTFGINSVKVTTAYDLPPKVGLNLRKVAFLALIKACVEYQTKRPNIKRIAQLAYETMIACYNIDPGWGIMGAFVGGVSLWPWQYPELSTRNVSLVNNSIAQSLMDRVLFFAPTGMSANSTHNVVAGGGYMNPAKRDDYINMLSNITNIGNAIQNELWTELGTYMQIQQDYELALNPQFHDGLVAYKAATSALPGVLTVSEQNELIMYYSQSFTDLAVVQTALENVGGTTLTNIQVSTVGIV